MARHSAAVYRRRRLALLLVLILLVAAVGVAAWLLVVQPWAGASPSPAPSASSSPSSSPSEGDPEASSEPTETDEASPSAEPTEQETPAIVACQAKDVVVEAVTDSDTYPAGVLPQLSISLTNKSDTDCTIDVGSSTQVFTVSSGSDVWWRSTDCQENPSSMIATLTAGSTVVSQVPVTWDRTRSSVETCAQENRPRAPGGGASYHVAVEIGGFAGVATTQFLLY